MPTARMLLAILVATMGVGCGAAAEDEAATSAETVLRAPRAAAPPRATGGSPAQRALLDAALIAVGAQHIASAEIVSVPDGFERPAGNEDAAWVRYTIVVPKRHESVRARWQAQVATGVFRARSADGALPLVLGMGTVIHTAEGELVGGGDGVISPPESDGAIADTTPRRLTEAVQEGAARLGLQVLSLRVTQPHHLAVEVRVETADPARFLRETNAGVQALFGKLEAADRPLAEGAYIEAVDASGEVFYARGYSTRLAEGSAWIRPDLLTAPD